jgi:hypothetical protein
MPKWIMARHVGPQPLAKDSRSNSPARGVDPLTKDSRSNPLTNCTILGPYYVTLVAVKGEEGDNVFWSRCDVRHQYLIGPHNHHHLIHPHI